MQYLWRITKFLRSHVSLLKTVRPSLKCSIPSMEEMKDQVVISRYI